MPDLDVSLFRRIPAVDKVLSRPEIRRLEELYGRDLVRVQVGRALDAARQRAREEGESGLESALADLDRAIGSGLRRDLGAPSRRVLNATGIFLHTNLGRAPLPPDVARALPALLDAYCDLEIDLESGSRGDRNARVAGLLEAATGAEAALVVNNNAAALVLVLATFARGREVPVSRGELVEIGGSFRIPEILEAAGATLREVGTTNRTRIDDYRSAMGPGTGLLLKVHPSNYRIRGFVEEVATRELAEIAGEVPLVVDEGAGLLAPREEEVFRDHRSVREHLADGADLVTSSGDKLLGGPQAGLLVGDARLVARCRSHPLYRALRPDRAALATLERVLWVHLRGGALPLDRLWPDPETHEARLVRIAERIGARIVPADAFVGGGAAPDAPIPGRALALPESERLAARLRRGDPAVVGYQNEGRLILDLRTVSEEDDEELVRAVLRAGEVS